MGESAVVKMNENGVMVLPIEIRKLLDVEGEKVYLRLNDIEVAKKLDEEGQSNGSDEEPPTDFVERFKEAVESGEPSEIGVREIRANIGRIEDANILEKAIDLEDRKTAREAYERRLNNV